MTVRDFTHPLRAAVVLTIAAGQLLAFSTIVLPSTASAAVTDPTWAWIQGQMRTETTLTTTSQIRSSQVYQPDWTGPVAGEFTLRDVPEPDVIATTPIVLDSPAPIDPQTHPVVDGRVELAPSPSRWIIDVQRDGTQGLVSAQVQTLVRSDGTFTVDLGQAVPGQGDWSLRVLDAQSGYAQVGEAWPRAAQYEGLEVRAIVITDTAYPIGSTAARADGTFAFDSSQPGAKVFQLVDVSSGDVLAEETPQTGLVRSFEVATDSPLHGRTFAYDQAMALLAARSMGEDPSSRALAQGLMALQTPNGPRQGAFVSSASSLNPAAARAEYRSGISSIATYALLTSLAALDPSDPLHSSVEQAARQGVDWLITEQITSGERAGLVAAGYGVEDMSSGAFDPTAVVPWISTEHNLDAWHTFTLAAAVLDSPPATAAADDLEDALINTLWDEDQGVFLQGLDGSGADATAVLDVNSWGAAFLDAAGHDDRAQQALANTSTFSSQHSGVVGYGPRPAGSSPLVWTEGTAGVALAEHRLGESEQAQATLSGLDLAVLPSGAYPAATRDDPQWEMSSAPAVGGSAWMVLVRQELAGHPSVWSPVGHKGESNG